MLTIAFIGPVNSGKSTLVNEIAGQEVSLVSSVPGTTTDPVRKRIELPGLGACTLIDTAGLDDPGILGSERERRTRAVLDEADVAVLLGPVEQVEKSGVPFVRYTRGESVESLLERIASVAPRQEERFLTGRLVSGGEVVLLVMPQDSEAPKGRLILPQVQVIRELLDRGCTPLCCTPASLSGALARVRPDLVITDSQVFRAVNEAIPASVPLTSFSVLLAGAKGDMDTFLAGARAISTLKPGDTVLIAEACTHVPDSEDIGRVKIPGLLSRYVQSKGGGASDLTSGNPLTICVSAGNDFPEDLSPYSLVIHCGACVATAALVRARTRRALAAGVPITNYGLALAFLQGILCRISLP